MHARAAGELVFSPCPLYLPAELWPLNLVPPALLAPLFGVPSGAVLVLPAVALPGPVQWNPSMALRLRQHMQC